MVRQDLEKLTDEELDEIIKKLSRNESLSMMVLLSVCAIGLFAIGFALGQVA